MPPPSNLHKTPGRVASSIIIAIVSAFMAAASAAPPTLPTAIDLALDGREARGLGAPVLILYSQAGCHWCEEARRYIVPLSTTSGTREKAVFRQIDIDSDAILSDFAGQAGSHRQFAKAHKIDMTPTVMLYAPDGQAIGAPIIGMRLPDFYAQYIINAIDAARAAIAAEQ